MLNACNVKKASKRSKMETMTITRALRELKTLDSRINKGIEELRVLDVTQKKYKDKALDTKDTITNFEKKAKSNYDSVSDLMLRRKNIKSSLMKANATTIVKLGSEEMTISEVIELKNSLPFLQSMYRKFKGDLAQYKQKLETARHHLDQQVENLVTQNTGKDRKADREDYEKIAVPFIEANELQLVDPLDVESIVKELEEKITLINDDVDITLSEINAKTEIKV